MSSKKSVKLFPNAKINLGLFIKGKRPDGYHLLETLYYPLMDLRDQLELFPTKNPTCHIRINGLQIDASQEDNLCYKAWQALASEIQIPGGVEIHLTKNIPAGAGLGGGSSDAAFTLKGLNELYQLGLSLDQLAAVGEKLGADVPFFLYNRPLLARGIGTEFEWIALDFPYRIEWQWPGIHSSTVAAYKATDYRMFDPTRDLKSILTGPHSQWAALLHNDLEVPVFNMYPQLAQIKADYYAQGALYAAMSGSGSAMFALFPS